MVSCYLFVKPSVLVEVGVDADILPELPEMLYENLKRLEFVMELEGSVPRLDLHLALFGANLAGELEILDDRSSFVVYLFGELRR